VIKKFSDKEAQWKKKSKSLDAAQDQVKSID